MFAANEQMYIEALKNATVQLDCWVRSPPNSNYTTTWLKRAGGMDRVVKPLVNGYTPLRLDRVGPEDAGTYSCFVSSPSAGNDETNLELKIVCKCISYSYLQLTKLYNNVFSLV